MVILGSLIGFYQAIVPLRVEQVPVRIANLPPSLHGTRLAVLGDLHVGLFTRPSRLDQIFMTTASLKPDAVLIAGDMIDDDPYFVRKLLAGLQPLPATIPIAAVLGNHEMYGAPQEVIARLRGSRIRLLVNEGFPLRDLWIAGVSDRAATQMPNLKAFTPNLAKALTGKPANAIAIALSHQPTIIADARKHALPLAICAHTHGGQLGIRPLGWSLAGVFLPYHMGLYDVPPTQLYVNTGTGYWLVPFRLGMTPEITLIELRP
jgi:predicted MPP superfamily phosphohydrolase